VQPPAVLRALVTPQADGGVAVVSGTGQAGTRVEVLVNNQVASTAQVAGNGLWSVTTLLGDPGQYRISVRGLVNGAVVNAVAAPLNVAVAVPIPTATPTAPPIAFQLVNPADGENGTGSRTFEWQSSYTPAEGEGFELVFWPPERDAMSAGFGLASPTNDTRLNLNLDKLDDILGTTFEPGPYNWGILLVRREPYERLRLLSEPRTFMYYRANDSGSSGGGDGRPPSSGEGEQSSGE
jgi:hypothetical protein